MHLVSPGENPMPQYFVCIHSQQSQWLTVSAREVWDCYAQCDMKENEWTSGVFISFFVWMCSILKTKQTENVIRKNNNGSWKLTSFGENKNNNPLWCWWPCPAARWGDAGILSGFTVLQRFVHWSTFLNMQWCCSVCCTEFFHHRGRTHVGFWQTLSDHLKKNANKKNEIRLIRAQRWTTGLFVHFYCLGTKEWAVTLGLVGGFVSGYIYLRFTSLHLKELVLTDRPLHQCPSMNAWMNNLISLCWLWNWKNKSICGSGTHDAGNLSPAETARRSVAKIDTLVKRSFSHRIYKIQEITGWHLCWGF